MKIFFSPQRSDKKVSYKFDEQNEIVTATVDGNEDAIDLSDFPEGARFEGVSEDSIWNSLLSKVERKNGEIYLTVMNYIGAGASELERFPSWKDAKDVNNDG
ncbi:hypothetical protein [Salibacterium halotolerans]|uniref:Uncharacterized protein n=1 Tax=Salibacterium halotolerans TaxID=1884432 RepID=A0A1I5NBM8_9BACI|nr:hypothetical protein [Salibacterium halotolerans]SFP19285.1 hypothetical protein SAMN05518683_10375 [Salibacterium halotolerans]